jgi:hypothetical protein
LPFLQFKALLEEEEVGEDMKKNWVGSFSLAARFPQTDGSQNRPRFCDAQTLRDAYH